MSILPKYSQFQNLICHFPEQITDRAVHLCSNWFIFEKLCFTVTLPRNAICYISHHLAMALEFSAEIYYVSKTPCRGFIPEPHWELETSVPRFPDLVS